MEDGGWRMDFARDDQVWKHHGEKQQNRTTYDVNMYAESVTQRSPGLPDECRATLGTTPAPRNESRRAGILQA